MTQSEHAKKGDLTPLMREVARSEGLVPKAILDGIAAGEIVIPANTKRAIAKPCGIGKGLRTKVNANLGTTPDSTDISVELQKLAAAQEAGADAVMDLSTGGDLPLIRKTILNKSLVPVGTVPIYEAAVNSSSLGKKLSDTTADEFFAVLERQAREGVDFFTIHAGVTRAAVGKLLVQKRLMGIVSRGGAILAQWMRDNDKENPFYEHFDRVLEITREYDVTISLGDGMRPGALADASDHAQIHELATLGELVKRARHAGVQVIVEGPGHLPMDQIEFNMRMAKTLCHNAPFYVLGPIVTDVAPGYDHITGAIGGAIAARHGADFLCYVTASEHLRLPTVADVKEGVIASRIAAHAADIATGVSGASEWDAWLSEARRKRDWDKVISLAMDPEKAKKLRSSSRPKDSDVCTMCGEYCSMKLSEKT